MKRLSARLFVTFAAVFSSVVGLSGPAHAAGELRIEVGGDGPLADLTQLVPGSMRQSRFSAANDSADDGVLRVRLTGLHEDDNGCVRPEQDHGDITCGDGGGELGRDLTVAVLPLGADGLPSGPALFSGSILDLADWTDVDPMLPAGTERSFRLDWALPKGSPNDTQTDTIAFALEFVLEQATVDAPSEFPSVPVSQPDDNTDVLSARPAPAGPEGTLAAAPVPEKVVVGVLPRTGRSLGTIAAAGGALAVLGALSLTSARRRRWPGSWRR